MRPSARALPNQPPDMAGPLTIYPPAAQGEKLRAPPPFGPLTPGDAGPGAPGLRHQPLIAPAHWVGGAPAQDDAASGPHGQHMAFGTRG